MTGLREVRTRDTAHLTAGGRRLQLSPGVLAEIHCVCTACTACTGEGVEAGGPRVQKSGWVVARSRAGPATHAHAAALSREDGVSEVMLWAPNAPVCTACFRASTSADRPGLCTRVCTWVGRRAARQAALRGAGAVRRRRRSIRTHGMAQQCGFRGAHMSCMSCGRGGGGACT